MDEVEREREVVEHKKHLVIVDGMALLFRSYFATAAMGHFFKNSQGIPTNAVQGYLRHVMTIVKHFDPTHLVVSWDMGAKTFRNEVYPEYKAHRPAPDAELVPQFDMTRQASELMGYLNIGMEQMEADDVIGSLVAQYSEDYQITIVSGDKDLFQLLRPNVTIALIKKGYSEYELYDEARFVAEYGFTPEQYVDYKAFIGDTADGYPGVKGIGPKTAAGLIQSYHTIEGILAAKDQLTKGVQKKLTEQEEMLHISYQLAAIRTDLMLTIDEEAARVPEWTSTQLEAMEALEYSLVVKYRSSLYR